MWGGLATCGRLTIGLPGSVQEPPRRVTNPPQVENLPHIRHSVAALVRRPGSTSEQKLQSELHDPRVAGGARDRAEGRPSDRDAGVGEVYQVQDIEQFAPELQPHPISPQSWAAAGRGVRFMEFERDGSQAKDHQEEVEGIQRPTEGPGRNAGVQSVSVRTAAVVALLTASVFPVGRPVSGISSGTRRPRRGNRGRVWCRCD